MGDESHILPLFHYKQFFSVALVVTTCQHGDQKESDDDDTSTPLNLEKVPDKENVLSLQMYLRVANVAWSLVLSA